MKVQTIVVCFCALALNAFLPACMLGQQSEESSTEVTLQVQLLNTRETAIDEALRKPARFDFFETRFEDIMAELETDYQIQIVLHRSSKDVGLDEETLITNRLEGISLGAALQKILGDKKATISVQDEVLNIVSTDYSRANPDLRIYDCTDMLSRLSENDTDSDVNGLIETLYQHVDPGSWSTRGGTGVVTHFNGMLVIRQTWENQKQSEELLIELDKKNHKQ